MYDDRPEDDEDDQDYLDRTTEASRAGPGEIADQPENPTLVRVRNAENNDEVTGYLMQWADAEWVYVDAETTKLYLSDDDT